MARAQAPSAQSTSPSRLRYYMGVLTSLESWGRKVCRGEEWSMQSQIFLLRKMQSLNISLISNQTLAFTFCLQISNFSFFDVMSPRPLIPTSCFQYWAIWSHSCPAQPWHSSLIIYSLRKALLKCLLVYDQSFAIRDQQELLLNRLCMRWSPFLPRQRRWASKWR